MKTTSQKNTAKRVFNEKTIKQTVPYNFKKVLAGIMLAAVPVFVACEKDPVKPNENGGNGGNGGNTQQKHNVELVYGLKPSTDWQNISLDTLYKYNSAPTVDTIFIVPKQSQQFCGLSTDALQTRVTKLRERHNVNPNKIYGKGNLELAADAVQNNNEIIRFFADTLKYNVKTR